MSPIAHHVPASDGYRLHTTTWPVAGTPRGRVVVLHGVQSHAGWYPVLGRTLAARGYEAHFPDRRGSGANPVERGHARSVGRLLRDVAEALESLRRADPPAPVALVGISWGGKLALVTAGDRPGLVDALALIAPGLCPRVGVTRGERLRIALAYLTGRGRRVRFPIPLADPALFTADPARQAFIAADPLSLRDASASLLAASHFLDRRVARAPAKVRQPALLMLAGRDRIVDNAQTRALFARLAGPDRRVIEYPEAHHTLEFEPDPSRHATDLADWLDAAIGKSAR